MPYIVITRNPHTIVIESHSLGKLYDCIVSITSPVLVKTGLNVDIVEKNGSQFITNEAIIVKNSEELLKFDVDYLAVRINVEEAETMDWSGDLSGFYLDYYNKQAFQASSQLSSLTPVVVERLLEKAEHLDDCEKLQLYKDIIQRRFMIKSYEKAFETNSPLPNF